MVLSAPVHQIFLRVAVLSKDREMLLNSKESQKWKKVSILGRTCESLLMKIWY